VVHRSATAYVTHHAVAEDKSVFVIQREGASKTDRRTVEAETLTEVPYSESGHEALSTLRDTRNGALATLLIRDRLVRPVTFGFVC
jgi:hypothetical protein